MKKRTRMLFKISLAFMIVFAFAFQAQAGEVYKLGLSLAITGPTSDAGNPYAKGVEDYFKYVNDMKLLGDSTIDCTIRDDQYKTDVTKRNFEDFIDMGIVFYLNYSTGSTMGLKRDFEEEQMPTIPASFHAGNLIDSNYIFLPIASYSAQMIGLAGLYFELSHPGAIFPGVIGGICLILSFFAMQTLPVNYAGILLIILSIILFILEMKIASYGLLSIAGIVSLLLGSLMMFEGGSPGTKLSWQVLLPTLVIVSGFFVFVTTLVFRSQVSKPVTGSAGLVGKTGMVKKRIAPEGKVFVHGELWNAVADAPIDEGGKVRIVRVNNLVLEVEEMEDTQSN